jgi:hypothetical protein
MSGSQTYNHFTKCCSPGSYGGLYTNSAAFTALAVLAGVSAFVLNPGAAVLFALVAIVGYCNWWLYYRLICLGGNQCYIGLALEVDTKADQPGLGKFDTDYTVHILPAPTPLLGDPKVTGKVANITWSQEVITTSPQQGNLLVDQGSTSANPRNTAFLAAEIQYNMSFGGAPVDGYKMLNNNDVPGPLTQGQLQARNLPTPQDWQPNFPYMPGDVVRDSNDNMQTCTPFVGSVGLSGAAAPNWATTPSSPPVTDNAVQWQYSGPIPAVAALEVEFEGAGVWDMRQWALAALPMAGTAAAVCSIPFIGWIACLILSLIALTITGIGAIVGLSDNSAQDQATAQVGNIQPLQSVLFVMGTWVTDGGHIPNAWNELHPVLFCQIIDTIPLTDLQNGVTWEFCPKKYSAANIQQTVAGFCGLAQVQLASSTAGLQALPQNGWTIHPLVDGCTPAQPPSPPAPPLQ